MGKHSVRDGAPFLLLMLPPPTFGRSRLAIQYIKTFLLILFVGTHFFLAVVIKPLTTHSVRDGAPFVVLIEKSSNFWALSTFRGI